MPEATMGEGNRSPDEHKEPNLDVLLNRPDPFAQGASGAGLDKTQSEKTTPTKYTPVFGEGIASIVLNARHMAEALKLPVTFSHDGANIVINPGEKLVDTLARVGLPPDVLDVK